MRYEIVDGLQIPKIGFGTWRIGGGSSPDRSQDPRYLTALRSALDLGYTHFDTAEMYGGGHAEELLGRAIRESGVPRDRVFITSKVTPDHLRYEQVLKACDASLRRLGSDYLDLYLIHWPSIAIKLPETFRALNHLVKMGKVRRLGVSNFDLRLLKAAEELSETPLLTNQVPYSLADRSYASNGVLAYCRSRGILLTAYEPVLKGRLKPGKALQAVAQARGISPYQIALAWLVTQPRVIAIPMSQDATHQRENLAAGDMELSEQEMAALG
ncbi:MAG: aldo/keto reductase [Anaerolineae bacterium]